MYRTRIKELREDHDLTQAQIAMVLHTTQRVYSRYETGTAKMPIHHLISLCEFYRVSADYILGLPKGLNWPR